MEMKKDDQKSIIIDVKMKNSEKWYAIEADKQLRACTQDCRTSALYQGIGRGDEVTYTINTKGQFSYLKLTGQKFDLTQLPKPTPWMGKEPIIDADKEQQQKKELEHGRARDPDNPEVPAPVPDKPKTDWERKFEMEQRKQEIIHWQALLNTATDIVMMSGVPSELGLTGVVKRVEKTAECLHEFIMVKVGEN